VTSCSPQSSVGSDVPEPSYILHSSPNRVHVFWRVAGFSADGVERLQKRLAAELGTDPAATSVTQNTRLPGFFYLKSPVVMAWSTTLRSQGVEYAAVTDSRNNEGRQWRPRASSFSSGASLFASVTNVVVVNGGWRTVQVCDDDSDWWR
jgi:DNA primase RepB-like protein